MPVTRSKRKVGEIVEGSNAPPAKKTVQSRRPLGPAALGGAGARHNHRQNAKTGRDQGKTQQPRHIMNKSSAKLMQRKTLSKTANSSSSESLENKVVNKPPAGIRRRSTGPGVPSFKLQEKKLVTLSDFRSECERLRKENSKYQLDSAEEVSLHAAEKTMRREIQKKYTDLQQQHEALQTQHTELAQQNHEQATLVQALQTEIAQLKAEAQANESLRRKMHNTILELKGNIRVFCRVRPLLASEEAVASIEQGPPQPSKGKNRRQSRQSLDPAVLRSALPAVHVCDDRKLKLSAEMTASVDGTRAKQSQWDFEFDRVFGESSGQGDVFEEMSELVQSVLDGYNCCVFAYGQTGSGKTYTMEGGIEEQQMGIIPRSVNFLFELKRKMEQCGWSISLEASQLEIYNETLRDLLADTTNGKLEVKHSRDGSVSVANLSLHTVESEGDIVDLLTRAQTNRSVAATKCNEVSSRSHSVFQLRVHATHGSESRMSHLVLVDLAGSERIDQSGAKDVQLKEAQAINKSLSALGNVIVALGKKKKHVPFRDSKLTHLLQSCLTGDSKCLMMVNISPASTHQPESLCSLRFAQKVNACEVGVAKRQGGISS